MIYKPSIALNRRIEDLYLDDCVNNKITMCIADYHKSNFPTPGKYDLKIIKSQAKSICEMNSTPLDLEKTIITLLITGLIGPEPDEMLTALLDHLYEYSRMFHKNELYDNPYFKNIKIEPINKGTFELKYNFYEAYELFCYDIPKRINDTYINFPKIGCFDEKVEFPCIIENGKVWMSITPNEIYTMKNPIKNAKGDVLTLGCGLGYFAYMASIKEDVKSVTIVEKEQEVIDIFNEYILPQFEAKDKITIIKADAIEYLKTIKDGDFDYYFADIWSGPIEGELYLTVKELTKHFKQTKCDYWIEESILQNLTKYVYLEIMKSTGNIISMLDDIGLEDKQYDYIKKLLKSARLKKPRDVDYYMDPITLKRLIEE